MKLTDLFGLLGGLALFLYGMQMMSGGLEAAAGNKMKKILEKLTANRFLGVLVGAGITAVIQSSSATTVMVVGFVNSGMMTLRQAVWIIMGANIGTTITGQLIALDIGQLAPLIAFIGVALIVFIKNRKVHNYGLIVAGLGMLFIGMEMMSGAMEPLRELPAFVSLMTKFSNPVLGILAGMIFTAIIQSSSASVGILQSLAKTGLIALPNAVYVLFGQNIGTCITAVLASIGSSSASVGILQSLAKTGLIALPNAVYVLFGQNIGTCITAVLASIGTSRSAKRTTIIHLMFNLIGTTLFTAVCILTPMTDFVAGLTPGNVSAQIANMHTIFNIVTTLLLLPFGSYLAKAAEKILPEKAEEKQEQMHLEYLRPIEMKGESHIGLSAILLNDIKRELSRMLEMTKENVRESFEIVLGKASEKLVDVEAREAYIDFLNKEISKYIAKALVSETNVKTTKRVSALFKVCGNLERIGDHAMYIDFLNKEISKYIAKALVSETNVKTTKRVSALFKVCGNLERIGDHAMNISEYTKLMQKYIAKALVSETNVKTTKRVSALFKVCGNLERIGDHAMNISEYTKLMHEKGIVLSPDELSEISDMQKTSILALEALETIAKTSDKNIKAIEQWEQKIDDMTEQLSEISDMQKTSILALEALETIAKTSDKNIKAIEQWEQKIDDMTEQFRANQTVRMQKGKTSDEACVIYSEMLTDFERIGDHVLNIGQEMGKGKVGA